MRRRKRRKMPGVGGEGKGVMGGRTVTKKGRK
jgi:hypothetical protein